MTCLGLGQVDQYLAFANQDLSVLEYPWQGDIFTHPVSMDADDFLIMPGGFSATMTFPPRLLAEPVTAAKPQSNHDSVTQPSTAGAVKPATARALPSTSHLEGETDIHPHQFRSFDEIGETLDRSLPVVTLFSGGLDSSYLLLRLSEMGFTEVHALSVDIGELETQEEKQHIAVALGVTLHVSHQQQVFADEFVAPAIKAQAVYLGLHPVSSSLSRPLIARTAVELARALGSRTIFHTANRSQNTLRRLNGALQLLRFDGYYGSPFDLQPVSRATKITELEAAGIKFSSDRTVSGDSNLWCREFESGKLDDPESHHVPEAIYRWSATSPELRARDEQILLSFEAGLPTAVDGLRMNLVDLIDHLNSRIGRLGVGRYTGLEHLDNGQKVLEIREMPAAWLIFKTARHLESACLPPELMRVKLGAEQLWTREALEGRWFGPLKNAIEAFVDSCSGHVTGSVKWSVHNGVPCTTAIIAEHPVYIRDREQWEADSVRIEIDNFSPLLTKEALGT